MATAMLSSDCVECGKPFGKHRGVQTHVYRRPDGFRATLEVPAQETVTIAQLFGAGQLSSEEADAAAGITRLEPRPIERPRDPNYSGPGHRHRRFPCAWWLARCKCRECNRTVDYAHIKAMEIECGIRDEAGNLVWEFHVGDQDEFGRTIVALVDGGQPVWDRARPPAPPRRDLGERSWV
jgi:hypothetical protein